MNKNWNHKYLKYKTKYLEKKAQLAQRGGAKAPAEKKHEKKIDDSPSLRITCVKVFQKHEDLHFEGSMCKTPAIKIRVGEDGDPKWARVVKALLQYVSKRLRMKEVERVEIKKKGAKTAEKIAGDKLGDTFTLSNYSELDEVVIYMN